MAIDHIARGDGFGDKVPPGVAQRRHAAVIGTAGLHVKTLRNLLGVFAVLLLLAPPVRAEPSEWRALAREMAAPWPGIQRPTGNLPDYLDGFNNPFEGTRYGDAMMGWALIQTGLREDDRALTDAGLHAIGYATSKARHWARPSVFETLAVASAWNLARSRLADDPAFLAIREQWADWLRR